MTDAEIKEIVILQKRGNGYTKIAKITRLLVNTVKSYVARHPIEKEDVCLCCGETLEQKDKRKHRIFCSKKCKNKWWYSHPHMMKKQTLTTFVCQVCGKEFRDYGKRVYCSIVCYAEARRKNNEGI